MHGYPYYAVSIALTHGSEVTHAVVLDPVRDELFTAIKGKGAQQNGTPIRTSTCVRVEDALVGTVFPAAHQREAAGLPPGLHRARSSNAPAYGARAPARSISPTSPRDGSTASA